MLEVKRKQLLRGLKDGYDLSIQQAAPQADPSWYAYRGYVEASGGAGAGHLAWERVAAEVHRVRIDAEKSGRPFDIARMAFAMGYGLGLRDHGRLSIADSELLIEAALPAAPRQTPSYLRMRFWFLVALLCVAEVAVVFTLEHSRPSYANLSEPLVHSPRRAGFVAADDEPTSGLSAAAERELVEATAAGTYTVRQTVDRMAGLPYLQAARIATQLFASLKPGDRLALVQDLQRLERATGTPLLMKAMLDSDARVVESAVGILAGRGEQSALPKIIQLLKHESPEVQRVCAEAVGLLGDREDGWHLVALLKSRDAELKKIAHRALVQLVGADHGKTPRKWWKVLPARPR